MPSKLDDYIRNNLDEGFSREEIRAELRRAGWPEADIDQAFYRLQNEPPVPEFSPSSYYSSQRYEQPRNPEPDEEDIIDENALHPEPTVNPKTNTLAIIALILSLVFLYPFSLILSIISLSQIKKTGEQGRVMAVIALVISIIGLIVASVLITLAVIAFYQVKELATAFSEGGLFNSTNLMPEKCTGMMGFDCVGLASSDSLAQTVTFTLKNSLASDLMITGFEATAPTTNVYSACQPGALVGMQVAGVDQAIPSEMSPVPVPLDSEVQFTVTCPGIASGETYEGEYVVKYTSESYYGTMAFVSIRGVA
jgi:hypothetical protein